MNRIYQGRVGIVELAVGKKEFASLADDSKVARLLGEELLWQHHALFQDAVNYYIVALAALGITPDSRLTRLRELLANVWEAADKKGQVRQGMRASLKNAWQLPEPPTLEAAVARFTQPLLASGVLLTTAEKAAEYVLFKLGGDAAIQQGGREFLPMFCDVECTATFKLSAARRGRADDEQRLQGELHRDLSQSEIRALAGSISLGSVVNLQPGEAPDAGSAVVERLKTAARTFAGQISSEQLEAWLRDLPPGFSLPKRRGGNINVKRVDACSLFLAFPNATTKAIFQSTFSAPKVKAEESEGNDDTDSAADETRFMVDGDDPIKLARGTRGFIFPGFTALPLWQGDGLRMAWKEFDIAAFKEALKVYNQFQHNVVRREEKLDGFATRLLAMDGERAIAAYDGDTDHDGRQRARLARIWEQTKGKPKLVAADGGEEGTVPNFLGDVRIDRLRQIINADLAEEYRLTDGRSTPYGLRRRTIKGWGDVRRAWQRIAWQEPWSTEGRTRLQVALDKLRGGEKREQIGSHKLFEELLKDEAAWEIWREPDEKSQQQIVKNNWATDPLEAFREYCEIREAMEEVSKRPLNFTPADQRYSRRLFMFTDVCSFGKDTGDYKHDADKLAVTVPVAVRNTEGRFEVRRCRLSYSAPRLLRDRIRAEDGAYIQDWAQPMMRALLGDSDENPHPQQLKDAAVQLMPDYDPKGGKRILLNFPLDLDASRIVARLGKADAWQKQFVSWKKGTQFPFLRWKEDFDGKEPHRWWERLSTFDLLAADLGTRHAASTALVECSLEKSGVSRYIGTAGDRQWYARYRSGTIQRLPGENAQVLRAREKWDRDGKDGKAFRQEYYGERGRSAEPEEVEEAEQILRVLGQLELLGEQGAEGFSFPELNDKLLVAIRRTQGWIAACISWHWKLTDPAQASQRPPIFAQLKEQTRKPILAELAKAGQDDHSAVRGALFDEIVHARLEVQQHLLKLTSRILPLRGRGWEWVAHPDKADCHLLRQTQDGTGPEDVKLQGQRGLSIARIEQLSELRRRWQSLNQSLRREIGERPPTASEMRADSIPDPCPDILTKLENIREQRVNQTAHLILAQALGLRLRAPEMSARQRRETDTHGEYEVVRPPVDLIVMEDLSRYLSDQGRARSENTRLMKWCHRAVIHKLKMLAEPFGLPVLETPAAYSSRFCSLTGIAGFRAAEVHPDDRSEFRWQVLKKEADQARAEGRAPEGAAAFAEVLFQDLEKIANSSHPNRTLLAPQPGGPIFITARPVPHPSPNKDRRSGNSYDVLPQQADLNAAINLALRVVAHPGCADIHHRLRTERKKGSKNSPDTAVVREARRFGKEKIPIIVRAGDSLPKERNPNLFYDPFLVADFGRCRLEPEANDSFPYASGQGLWKEVNDRNKQWARCQQINDSRLAAWKQRDRSDISEDNLP